MTKLTIALTRDEMEKLRRAARTHLRQPDDQARYIIRSVLLGESPPSQGNKNTIVPNVSQAQHDGVNANP
jgi:plasmid stability protein